MDPWSRYLEEKESCRWGAVLVTMVSLVQGPRLVLIVRSGTMRIHQGQVAFPGGSMEEGDLSPWDTAVREAEEEIGLKGEDLEYLGGLPPEEVMVSSFRVVPVFARIGRVMDPREFEINRAEVSRLIFCDISTLSSEPEVVEGVYGGIRYEYPVYPLDPDTNLWGASARILRKGLDAGFLAAKKV